MDDPFDGDYVDDQDEASAVDTTPSSRLVREVQLNEESRKRVRANDPNKGRCLIENCPESRSVDFCHCVPRSFTYRRPDLMSSIEWHWKMKYSSLNLDSSHNIFRAGVSVHRLFDNHSYLLLPENEFIDIYHNALEYIEDQWIATRETFPDIPNGTNFKYKLIPLLRKMEDIAIHRQNTIPDPGHRPKSDDYTTHIYPYENMPLLQSHLHPRFVILEAGRKLAIKMSLMSHLGQRYPVLWRVLEIYEAWTRDPPSGAKEDKTYGYSEGAGNKGGGRGGGGGDDADTNAGRRSNGKRDRDMGGGDSPTPDSKHGKHTHHGELGSRKRKNSICLSEKTLIEHEQTFGNKKKWSSETVQVWCKNVLDEQAPPPQLSVE